MNIQGFAFKNNKNVNSVEDFGKLLNLELSKEEEVHWIDYETGFYSEDKILILNYGSSYVIYPSEEILDNRENDYVKILENSEEGFTFALSETSMVFMFTWFEKGKSFEEDLYNFMQEEYEIEGKNKLNLTTKSDIIFDGFFPYLKEFFGTNLDDKKAYIYSCKTIDNDISKSQQLGKIDSTKKIKYSDKLNEVLFQNKINNGIDEIYKLRNILSESFRNGGNPPRDYNMDYIKTIPVKKVKSEIKTLARDWRYYGNNLSTEKYYKLIKIALAWTFYEFEPNDLKRKWWKF